jgi:hypothetical protein
MCSTVLTHAFSAPPPLSGIESALREIERQHVCMRDGDAFAEWLKDPCGPAAPASVLKSSLLLRRAPSIEYPDIVQVRGRCSLLLRRRRRIQSARCIAMCYSPPHVQDAPNVALTRCAQLGGVPGSCNALLAVETPDDTDVSCRSGSAIDASVEGAAPLGSAQTGHT